MLRYGNEVVPAQKNVTVPFSLPFSLERTFTTCLVPVRSAHGRPYDRIYGLSALGTAGTTEKTLPVKRSPIIEKPEPSEDRTSSR